MANKLRDVSMAPTNRCTFQRLFCSSTMVQKLSLLLLLLLLWWGFVCVCKTRSVMVVVVGYIEKIAIVRVPFARQCTPTSFSVWRASRMHGNRPLQYYANLHSKFRRTNLHLQVSSAARYTLDMSRIRDCRESAFFTIVASKTFQEYDTLDEGHWNLNKRLTMIFKYLIIMYWKIHIEDAA